MKQATLIPKDDDIIDLRGTVERIVFHNDENGYTVFRFRPESQKDDEMITAVGYMASPQGGMMLHLRGKWVNNPRFGRQFQMTFSEETRPSSLEGITLYLSSGLIKGIGKTLAARIVEKFGKKTLDVLDQEPERLLDVKGVSPKKLETIVQCWNEHMGIRELMLFLQPHGIGAAYALRIYRHYHEQALATVRENPYRLAMDISGIGFLTADALAAKLGFAQDSPLRAQAGTLYTLLRMVDEGHVYCPQDILIQHASEQLHIDPALVSDALKLLEDEQRVVLEDFGDHTGVYLSRFHHYESKIAFYLRRIMASPKSIRFPDSKKAVKQAVKNLEIELAPEQMDAVRTAADSKLMVLTGGPGTGKTTIIKAIINLFAEHKAKILLAAPTGRAAKRMSEACGREAKTIHRLLEYRPQEDGFGRNEDNPLACSLLVVDEASMMDTMLAYHLLKAAPLGATIIFVGDIHQLPSVGPGNVLGDFISSGAIPVVELVEVFRQAASSDIVCNAHLINKGEMPALESSPSRLSDFYFIRQNDPEQVADIIVDLVRSHIPRRFGFNPVEDIQVLTPMHKGVAGSENLNLRLQQALNPSGPGLKRGERVYRCNDKVMQIRNNYEKDVFNGDIGHIILADLEEKRITVRYDERTVCYESDELDEIVPAYAISIHKSQGSEYPAVVIPLLTQHYILLQRNLVYTGITRGKKLVVLVGENKALSMAIRNNKTQKRYTRLAERLRQPAGISDPV